MAVYFLAGGFWLRFGQTRFSMRGGGLWPPWEAHHFNNVASESKIKVTYIINIIMSKTELHVCNLTGSFQRSLLRCIPLSQHSDSPQTIAVQLDGSPLRSENETNIYHKVIKQMFCHWPQVCGIDHEVYSKCQILWSR